MYTVLLLALALSLPDALLNRPYTYDSPWVRVSSRCAMPIPATRVVAGTLPAGLQLTDRGEMLGVPTQPGKYGFTVEVSDGCSRRLEERQIRVAPAPILTAEAEELEFNCPQGAPPFSAGIVRVSGSTPGHAYSVDILEGPWLQATMRDGILPPENSALEADTVRLSINPAKLAPGAYTARLRLSIWQGANTPELLFRLRVDSPQTIFAPLTPKLAPSQIIYQLVEIPQVQVITLPPVSRPDPPRFPLHQPKSGTAAKSSHSGLAGPGRSRVLPFPKVTITPRPPSKPKAEPPPERTKPSAMPPTAQVEKPKPAH